jgi:sn-glycerol 3-phosphate transport system substrate-binding protein
MGSRLRGNDTIVEISKKLNTMKKITALILASFLFTSSLFAAPVKLELWHAMEGFIAEKLQEFVDKFNESQKDYEVHLIRNGNYTETFKEGVKAVRAKKGAPHILQVYEIATPTFMQAKDVYVPVHELFKKHGFALPQKAFISAITDFYSDDKGQLLGLPFNIATGLLFYNKEAFKKAGLDPQKPPKTWEEFETYAIHLKQAGYACALTTAWPSGYLLEHFSSRHNVPFTTKKNGFQGCGARLLVNSPPYIFNLEKLAKWQKEGVFHYAGRFVEEPEKLFTSGQCAMLMQSNSRMAILKKAAIFEIGGGPIPYWKSLTKEPHNLVTGGAALWAIKGHSPDEEKGIATFFNFVALPENQKSWVEATGYLPVSKAAYEMLKEGGYYQKNPHNDVAIQSLMLPATPYSKGIRVPGFVEVREVLIDALEAAFKGEKTAKEALDEATREGNKFIESAESVGP